MPRKSHGARLYLQPERRDGAGNTIDRSVWVIRDGATKRRTRCGPGDRAEAERLLAVYITEKYKASRERDRDPSRIAIADVLNIYLTDRAPKQARPAETAGRVTALLGFWGDKRLSAVSGATCRAYVEHRGSVQAARRELEDLRAAISHHRREGYCSEQVSVVLPDRAPSRERWLTRSEVARLLWAAWRYREVQKGVETDRHSRRHVARFILIAVYTGTRSAAICGAALGQSEGGGWIDLEHGVFYRRARGARETKKRQPPIRLPSRLLAHLRRWARLGQRHAVEWNRAPVDSVRKAFAASVLAAELGGDVTPHTLRHTAATWLMQREVPIWEASGYLGMTPATLERIYGHHHPDHQSNAVTAFDRPGQKPDRLGGTDRDSVAWIGVQNGGKLRR